MGAAPPRTERHNQGGSRHLGNVSTQSSASTLRRSVVEPLEFVDFYRRYFDSILVFLARRVCDAEVALDLAAEALAQAYAGRHRFRGSTDSEAEAWIYRIAKRQLTRYIRRGKLERKALQRLGIDVPQIDADQRARIEKLAELDDLKRLLRGELARLSVAQREALWLRVVNELPYADVVERLKISEQAARLRVSRALRSLGTSMDGNPNVEELRT